MRSAATWIGFTGLALLLTSCSGSKPARLDAQVHSRLNKQYPSAFCKPSRGLAGIGFSPLGAFTSDAAYAQAAQMACTHLAWSTYVRVRGSQLSGESFGAIGQKVDMIDLPTISPEQCRLDSFEVDDHGWILAASGGGADWGGVRSFPKKRPGWIRKTPDEQGWHYGRGQMEASYVNEAGSWETATYRALVDLAFSFGRIGTRRTEANGIVSEAQMLETDVGLRGLRVLKRWRDKKHGYVLVGVQASGLTSFLGKGAVH